MGGVFVDGKVQREWKGRKKGMENEKNRSPLTRDFFLTSSSSALCCRPTAGARYASCWSGP